jgi:biopolymer transport protein ExbD
MAIQITKDNRDIIRTHVAGHSPDSLEIRNDDTASLRRQLQKSCEPGTIPSVSIHIDTNGPFQSLVNVIVGMVPARVASFEVTTEAHRIVMRIPEGRPKPGQTEIKLSIDAQGAYGLNDGGHRKQQRMRDLSRLIMDRMTGKKCCYVVVNADAKAPAWAFVDAVSAVQLASIDDYWIGVKSDGDGDEIGKRNALEKRIRELEDEQKRLRRELREKPAG